MTRSSFQTDSPLSRSSIEYLYLLSGSNFCWTIHSFLPSHSFFVTIPESFSCFTLLVLATNSSLIPLLTMKLSLLLVGAAIADLSFAHPGMKDVLVEIQKAASIDKRAAGPELIGDLLTKGNTTKIGTLVKECLLTGADCHDRAAKVKSYFSLLARYRQKLTTTQ